MANWFRRWRGSTRRIAELEHSLAQQTERVACLEEILAAYRDTLETHQREAQVRTAIALTEREHLRAVEGGRTR